MTKSQIIERINKLTDMRNAYANGKIELQWYQLCDIDNELISLKQDLFFGNYKT